MTEVLLILSFYLSFFISSGLEFWAVSHASIYENSESKVIKI